ncbi:hypothetical protein AAC387_Pa04g0486 [Persea americana]
MTRRKPHYMRHLEWGNWKIVKELLDACPSVVYMLNRDKESSLFIACSYGHMEVALELCSRIDFLAWDEIGASCLEIAASNGYTQVENCSAAGDIKMVDMTRLVNGLYFIAHSFAPPGTKANAANNEGNTALDTLEQIAARDSDANVANDSYCRRMTIIKQLKARKRANPASLTDMQMKLIAVVGLIGTVTIQAVLSPPGALCKI